MASKPPLTLIMAGPPGAGKTTQGRLLADHLGIPHISMGNLLRHEVQASTALGARISALLEHGDLVSTEIAHTVITQRLLAADACAGFILDGFPRRDDDAQMLRAFCATQGIERMPMLLLEIAAAEVYQRLEHRRICASGHLTDVQASPPQRPGHCDHCGMTLQRRNDDTPATIAHRFEVYRLETQPVLTHWARAGHLFPVSAAGSVEDVAKNVLQAARLASSQSKPPAEGSTTAS